MKNDLKQLLSTALTALNQINDAYAAQRLVVEFETGKRTFTAPILEGAKERALSAEQIEKLSLDTWEAIVMELASTARPFAPPQTSVSDKPWGIRGGRGNKWVTHEVNMAFATEAEAQEVADSLDTKEGRWGFTAERFTSIADDGWPAELADVDLTGATPAVLERAAEQVGEKLAGVHAPICVGTLGCIRPGEARAPAVWPRALPEAHGHDEPCPLCTKPCNAFAGDPGLWPIALVVRDGEVGAMRWHHMSCVSERLARLVAIESGGSRH